MADLRSALREALAAAQAEGVLPEIRMALLISELGHEIADTAVQDELNPLVASVQAAVEHAARTARDDQTYQNAVERSVDHWLN